MTQVNFSVKQKQIHNIEKRTVVAKGVTRDGFGFWVTKSCPTLCEPMDCSMPVLPGSHHLPEFAQVHVHYT